MEIYSYPLKCVFVVTSESMKRLYLLREYSGIQFEGNIMVYGNSIENTRCNEHNRYCSTTYINSQVYLNKHYFKKDEL